MSGWAAVVKPWARHARAAAIRATGRLRRLEAARRGALTILCYHRVLPEARKRAYFIPDLAVTPEAFAGHCAALRDRFEVLPLSEAHDRWRTGAHAGKPLAAITFDDGYRDNFVHARPVLESLGLRATFFVVTGLIGSGRLPWYDHLGHAAAALSVAGEAAALEAHLGGPARAALRGHAPGADYARALVEHAKALSPEARTALLADAEQLLPGPPADPSLDHLMDEAQLRALHAAGHEIGSHTHTHPILPQLEAAALRAELVQSRDAIAAAVGEAPRAFCYPNGDFNDAVADAVAAAGYALATTTAQGVNAPGAEPLRLARVFIHEGRLSRPWGGVSPTLLRLECAAGIRT